MANDSPGFVTVSARIPTETSVTLRERARLERCSVYQLLRKLIESGLAVLPPAKPEEPRTANDE